jgi:hypothetical protein
MSNTVIAARGGSRKAGKFSARKMNTVIDEVVDKLDRSIRKQNPDADVDAIESDIRALVMKHGGGSSIESTASISGHEYNLAADVICLAHEKFTAGDISGCLELCAAAMQTDDIKTLVATLNEVNENTDVNFKALADMADGDGDEDEDDDSSSDEDNTDEDDSEEDDDSEGDDTGDNETTSSDDEEEPEEPEEESEEETTASDDDEDDTDEAEDDDTDGEDTDKTDDEDEDEDDDEINSAIANVTASFTANKMSNEQRALLNKLSLTGKPAQRKLARAITK